MEGYRTMGTQRNNLERGVPKPGVPKKILSVGNPGSRGTEKRDTEKIFLDPGVPKKGYRKKGSLKNRRRRKLFRTFTGKYTHLAKNYDRGTEKGVPKDFVKTSKGYRKKGY